MIKHKKNCVAPRLSDEEPDLMEQEDMEGMSGAQQDGWLPWTHDDLLDIKRIMEQRMPSKQREIMEAFLAGMTAKELRVTEKYWRYHFKRAIKFIREELDL